MLVKPSLESAGGFPGGILPSHVQASVTASTKESYKMWPGLSGGGFVTGETTNGGARA